MVGHAARLVHAPFWAPSFAALESSPDGLRDAVRIFSYAGKAKGEHSVDIPSLADRIAQHDPSAQHVVMNSLDKLIEKGRKQGLEKGLEKGLKKGLKKGQAKMFLDFLRDKYGDLSEDDVARVEQADEETLERYRKRFATADSVAAVLGSD